MTVAIAEDGSRCLPEASPAVETAEDMEASESSELIAATTAEIASTVAATTTTHRQQQQRRRRRRPLLAVDNDQPTHLSLDRGGYDALTETSSSTADNPVVITPASTTMDFARLLTLETSSSSRFWNNNASIADDVEHAVESPSIINNAVMNDTQEYTSFDNYQHHEIRRINQIGRKSSISAGFLATTTIMCISCSIVHLGFVWGSYISDHWSHVLLEISAPSLVTTNYTIPLQQQQQQMSLPIFLQQLDTIATSHDLWLVLSTIFIWCTALAIQCLFMVVGPIWIYENYQKHANDNQHHARTLTTTNSSCKGKFCTTVQNNSRYCFELLVRWSFSIVYVLIVLGFVTTLLQFNIDSSSTNTASESSLFLQLHTHIEPGLVSYVTGTFVGLLVCCILRWQRHEESYQHSQQQQPHYASQQRRITSGSDLIMTQMEEDQHLHEPLLMNYTTRNNEQQQRETYSVTTTNNNDGRSIENNNEDEQSLMRVLEDERLVIPSTPPSTTPFRLQPRPTPRLETITAASMSSTGMLSDREYAHQQQRETATAASHDHPSTPRGHQQNNINPVVDTNNNNNTTSFVQKVLVFQTGLLSLLLIVPVVLFPMVRIDFSGLAAGFLERQYDHTTTAEELLTNASGSSSDYDDDYEYVAGMVDILALLYRDSRWATKNVGSSSGKSMTFIFGGIIGFVTALAPIVAFVCAVMTWVVPPGKRRQQWHRRLHAIHPLCCSIVFATSFVIAIILLEPWTTIVFNNNNNSNNSQVSSDDGTTQKKNICQTFMMLFGDTCLVATGTVLKSVWYLIAQTLLFELFIGMALHWS